MGRYEQAIQEQQKGKLLGGSSPEEAGAEAAAMLKAFKSEGAKESGNAISASSGRPIDERTEGLCQRGGLSVCDGG